MSAEGYIYLPAPLDVATACSQRAWDDDVQDDDRLLLEVAYRTIEQLITRTMTLAHALERTEAGL